MVNKSSSRKDSSQGRRCKPIRIRFGTCYRRDVQNYTCSPPSNVGYGGFNLSNYENEDDITPITKGGKLLGYVTFDPRQPERGLFVTTIAGEEIDSQEKEKKNGWGYVWTKHDIVNMIYSERQRPYMTFVQNTAPPCPPYFTQPNIMMPPPVVPIPPAPIPPAPIQSSNVGFVQGLKGCTSEKPIQLVEDPSGIRPPCPTTSFQYPHRSPPVTNTHSTGIQACDILQTCDRRVDASCGPCDIGLDNDYYRDRKKESLNIKQPYRVASGCEILKGPCSDSKRNDAVSSSRSLLGFVRKSIVVPSQRGFADASQPEEISRNVRSVSTQYDQMLVEGGPSSKSIASLPPNTSRILILRRSPSKSPPKASIASKDRTSVEKEYVAEATPREEKKDSSSDDGGCECNCKQRKWYFEGFRHPARKRPNCIIC